VLFVFAYVRAVSSTPLIVYAALVTSVPPLMVVNAGAINTSKTAMMAITINSSNNVKAPLRSRCESEWSSVIGDR
jgi:ABC-type amino acid transport system permease subunit